jgi:hypothetical protein
MNLKAALPPMAPVRPTEEAERRILSATTDTQEERHKDISKEASPASAAAGARAKEGTVLMNAKIPLSLHTRLKRTAQYNDVSMTDILLRGIEAELQSGRYAEPPRNWGSKVE